MNGSSGRRCAVVYNPIKVSDELREAISRQATATGWEDADLAGDSSEDPGPAITRSVVSAGRGPGDHRRRRRNGPDRR